MRGFCSLRDGEGEGGGGEGAREGVLSGSATGLDFVADKGNHNALQCLVILDHHSNCRGRNVTGWTLKPMFKWALPVQCASSKVWPHIDCHLMKACAVPVI